MAVISREEKGTGELGGITREASEMLLMFYFFLILVGLDGYVHFGMNYHAISSRSSNNVILFVISL